MEFGVFRLGLQTPLRTFESSDHVLQQNTCCNPPGVGYAYSQLFGLPGLAPEGYSWIWPIHMTVKTPI